MLAPRPATRYKTMVSKQQSSTLATQWGESFSNAGHHRSSIRAPFPAPLGMRWYCSTVTGQWHLEVK